MSAGEILEQIRKLPKDEQLTVFEHLRDEFESIDDGLTPAQAAELKRRIEDHQKNPDAGIPWEQIKAEAEKKYGWK